MSKGGHGVSSYTHTQSQLDNYANQHNPNNAAYAANCDNHANQCNPNNEAYADGLNNNANQCEHDNITPDKGQ